jgi:hypothetical protein
MDKLDSLNGYLVLHVANVERPAAFDVDAEMGVRSLHNIARTVWRTRNLLVFIYLRITDTLPPHRLPFFLSYIC